PGFLGATWPAFYSYVGLAEVIGRRVCFCAHVRSTTCALAKRSTYRPLSAKRKDVERLLQVPGPTCVIGVHEPSRRVFIRSVHAGTPLKAMTRIPLTHELTSANLQALHDEVRTFWSSSRYKPTSSVFA